MKQWKGFEYGINFGGWLSQCPPFEEHYASFIKAEDFVTVKEWGHLGMSGLSISTLRLSSAQRMV